MSCRRCRTYNDSDDRDESARAVPVYPWWGTVSRNVCICGSLDRRDLLFDVHEAFRMTKTFYRIRHTIPAYRERCRRSSFLCYFCGARGSTTKRTTARTFRRRSGCEAVACGHADARVFEKCETRRESTCASSKPLCRRSTRGRFCSKTFFWPRSVRHYALTTTFSRPVTVGFVQIDKSSHKKAAFSYHRVAHRQLTKKPEKLPNSNSHVRSIDDDFQKHGVVAHVGVIV